MNTTVKSPVTNETDNLSLSSVKIYASSRRAKRYVQYILSGSEDISDLMTMKLDPTKDRILLVNTFSSAGTNSPTKVTALIRPTQLLNAVHLKNEPKSGIEVTRHYEGGTSETESHNLDLFLKTFPVDETTRVKHSLFLSKIEDKEADSRQVMEFIKKQIRAKTACTKGQDKINLPFYKEVRFSVARDFNSVFVNKGKKRFKSMYVVAAIAGIAPLFTRNAAAITAGLLTSAGFIVAGSKIQKNLSKAKGGIGFLSGKSRKTDFTVEEMHSAVMKGLDGYGIKGEKAIASFLKEVENPPHKRTLLSKFGAFRTHASGTRTFSL